MPQTGLGGHMKLGPAVTFPVAEWQKEATMRLAESTTSATGIRRSNILEDGTWSVSFPWELNQIPEEVGLFAGADVPDLRLLIGSSGKMYKAAAKVEKVSVVEDVAKDVIRCIVSGFTQGGWGVVVDAV